MCVMGIVDVLVVLCGLYVEVYEEWEEFDFGDWDGVVLDVLLMEVVLVFYLDLYVNLLLYGESWGYFECCIVCGLYCLLDDLELVFIVVVSYGGLLWMVLL